MALCACSATTTRTCDPPERAVVNDVLYFGTDTPHGTVSADQWNAFIDTVVTPRFPMGLTVWPASGQWQSANGRIIHESSYVLALVHRDDRESEVAVRTIVSTYKADFTQEAVMRVRSMACVSP